MSVDEIGMFLSQSWWMCCRENECRWVWSSYDVYVWLRMIADLGAYCGCVDGDCQWHAYPLRLGGDHTKQDVLYIINNIVTKHLSVSKLPRIRHRLSQTLWPIIHHDMNCVQQCEQVAEHHTPGESPWQLIRQGQWSSSSGSMYRCCCEFDYRQHRQEQHCQ